MAESSFERWCARRRAELAGPDSWLGMIGLHWLTEGRHRVGGAADDDVLLPDMTETMGELQVKQGEVSWQAVGAAALPLQTDRTGQPTSIELGPYAFFIVERDGRLGLRLRNRAWALQKPFKGLDLFAYDPAWVFDADWQALDIPLDMEVPNVAGDLKSMRVSHQAVFTVAGETVRLLPIAVDEQEVFFVFRDRSSGRETYGAGRFLKAPPPVDGKIRLDFNFSFNPPCAFTAFATCPLPPTENWLPFAVPAGEKKPL